MVWFVNVYEFENVFFFLEPLKVGDDCIVDTDCEEIKNSFCDIYDDDKCKCSDGFVPSINKTSCYKIIDNIGDECEITEQCQKISSASPAPVECINKKCTLSKKEKVEECSEDVKCVKGSCVRGMCVEPAPLPSVPVFNYLGQPCGNNSDCNKVLQSDCVDYKCQCLKGFVPSQNLRFCLPIVNNLGDPCEESVQCEKMNGSVCVNDKCVEKMTKFLLNDNVGSTSLLLGSTCDLNDDCKHIKNAICNENICECLENYVTSVSSNKCLIKGLKEGDYCEVDQQCLNVKDATCIDNKCLKTSNRTGNGKNSVFFMTIS
ncbi:conserved hypothetical protein [Pediculus humanus corporis]|uniref:EB domain-containing protein n=1 Tax=Pediculus humanus subsp. corporis TaxID=121224 RepID=E0VTW5_PEDHC|nr:uncharacterized protein Phum_PHUM439870 [Pediculus humanus corporis]EEB16821.1 conserved hypothetical protein [Pediculus humanus corporis]